MEKDIKAYRLVPHYLDNDNEAGNFQKAPALSESDIVQLITENVPERLKKSAQRLYELSKTRFDVDVDGSVIYRLPYQKV